MNIETWIRNLVTEFRKQFKILPEAVKPHVSNLDNYNSPCQIDIITCKIYDFIVHSFVVFHDPERDDMQITCKSFSIDDENATQDIDNYLELKQFKLKLNDKRYLGDEIKRRLQNLIDEVRKNLKGDEARFTSSTSFGDNSFGSLKNAVGNIQELDYTELVKAIMDDAQNIKDSDFFNPERMKALDERTRNQECLMGGFLNPPYWIGEQPNFETADIIKGTPLIQYIKQPINQSLRGNRLIIKSDGYIALQYRNVQGSNTFPSREELNIPKRNFNILFALMRLYKYPIKSFHRHEMSAMSSYLPESDILSESYPAKGYSENQSKKRFGKIDPIEFDRERTKISINEITEIISLHERLITYPDIEEMLILFIEGISNIESGEISQAFISHWTITEQFFNRLLKKMITERNITGDRKDFLNRINSIRIKLEILELNGLISLQDYQEIRRLNNIRNGFIHKIKPIQFDDARGCSIIAFNVLSRLLNEVN